ncbi:hypothetical protein ABZ313_24035 [Streptomyces sp. NPDC006251]|uniref:hypothetical protein n=1 Tax=Streptomyces sp. NPDC006251 TaxID=3155718 RepID=UPI0033B1A6D6
MRPAIRLWAGVLMLCALTLCLTGLARPAVAMSAPMGRASAEAQAMDAVRPGAEHTGPAVAAADSSDMGGHCPAVSDHRGRAAAVPSLDGPAAPAAADAPREATGTQLWQARAGPVAAGPVLPPDLHRICVLRT